MNHIIAYSQNIERSRYTEGEKLDLLWIAGLATRKGWSLNDICEQADLDCDKTILSRILKGTYPGNTAAILARISDYRAVADEIQSASQSDVLDFVETSLARHLWAIADRVRTQGSVGIVVGNTQIGKTIAMEEYARRHADNTIVVRCPVSASPGRILSRIASAMRTTSRGKPEDMIAGILGKLSKSHMLIIDEIQHVVLGDAVGRKGLEQLRELKDLSECSMVLVADNSWSRIRESSKWQDLILKLEKRGAIRQYALPERLTEEDVCEVWQHYGLQDPDAKLKKHLIALAEESGWGRYTKRMQVGYNAAIKQGVRYDWRYYLAAEKQLTEYESGQIDYHSFAKK